MRLCKLLMLVVVYNINSFGQGDKGAELVQKVHSLNLAKVSGSASKGIQP